MPILLSILICWVLIHYTPVGRFIASYTEKWAVYPVTRWGQLLLLSVILILFLSLFRWVQIHNHWVYFIISCAVLLYGWAYSRKELPFSAVTAFSHAVSSPFAVIFWFVILGPWGVLLYDFVRRGQLIPIQQLLEWPAARILGLGYALAGYFPPAFSYWTQHLLKSPEYNQQFLAECGAYALNASLTAEINAQEASALISRSELLLLIIMALLVSGGLLY